MQRALNIFRRLETVSPGLARALATRSLPRILPITAGMGLRVLELSEERSRVRLPLSRRSRNHVGGLYLGAQTIAAEVAMALVVLRRHPPPRYRVLIGSVEASFHAQGRGDAVATCAPNPDVLASMAAVDDADDDRVKVWVPVQIRDAKTEDADPITVARFEVAIKRLRR